MKFLLTEEGTQYVLTEKFNQDPLESFFGNMRQMRGGNEAPNVQQFNENINAARLKSTQMLKNFRGNTQQLHEHLATDDTPLPKKKRVSQKKK